MPLVHSAIPSENGVRIQLESGAVLERDHLIIATQANAAARMLPNASWQEVAMLKSFTYEDIEVVLHHDEHSIPVRKSDWSTFNFLFENTNSQPCARFG